MFADTGTFTTNAPDRKWKPAPVVPVVPFESADDVDEIARLYDELSEAREQRGGRTVSCTNIPTNND